MTSTSRLTVSPGCLMPSVVRARVSGISETVKLVVGDRHDGERDAVDGDRPLVDQVAAHPVGEADLDDLPVLAGGAGQDLAGAVDVALDDVPAEPLLRGDRALEVDPGAGPERPERGLVERLAHHVGGEDLAVVAHDREAAAVDGDRVAVARVGDDQRPAHAQAYGVALVLDGLDGAELLDDPGEHGQSLPSASGSVWGRISSRTLSSRTVTSSTRRCSASEIVVIPRSPTALRPAPRSMGAT